MSRAVVPSGLRVGSVGPRVPSDESLALRAAEGDEQALAAIFSRHHQSLYRYCLALLGNGQDAQDALQNVMIKVLRALPGEQRHIELKPWLYRIAHNESIELLRRRRETRPLDPGLAAAGSGLAETAAARERLRVLISDLDRLPERQRGVLVMRELAGLDFAEIGIALGTSAAVARQTLYEARLSLRQMDEGREMSCERVTRALSDGDGRVARRRDLRSHLRTCPDCRGFGEEIESREREFAALAPLPAAAAAGLLQGLIGGQGATGGGLVGTLGGGAAKSLGASAALKGAATVAVVAAIGAGVADRSGLIDLGASTGGHSQATRSGQADTAEPPGTSPARSGPAAASRVSPSAVAKAKSSGNVAGAQTAPVVAPKAGGDETSSDNAKLTEPGEPGAQVVTGGGATPEGEPAPTPAGQANSAAPSAPASGTPGKGREKQLPSASEHGQQTAESHKAANHGQETAANHKAGAQESDGHPTHPATPSHPAQTSNPGAEEEPAPPSTNPAVPESNGNGNGKGKGNGKGASSAAEESPPPHESDRKP